MTLLRAIWYVLTLRCEEADRVRTRRIGGAATRRERLAEDLHRLICASCRRARRQLEVLDDALRSLEERLRDEDELTPSLGVDARSRILGRIEQKASGPVQGPPEPPDE